VRAVSFAVFIVVFSDGWALLHSHALPYRRYADFIDIPPPNLEAGADAGFESGWRAEEGAEVSTAWAAIDGSDDESEDEAERAPYVQDAPIQADLSDLNLEDLDLSLRSMLRAKGDGTDQLELPGLLAQAVAAALTRWQSCKPR
jgi:hypothetical protein